MACVAACVPFGFAGQGGVVPAGTPSPAPSAQQRLSYLEGTVYSPGDSASGTSDKGSSYRIAAFAPARAAGALVHLSSPDERPYFDASGRPLATTADAEGRFRLPAEPGKPLVITAVTSGDQRLVSFATLAATGSATVDVSLETTYATEFLRRYAARAGKTLADFGTAEGLEALALATSLTRQMLGAAQLDPAPDLAAAEIPTLVDEYLIAMARHRKDLSDLWRNLLGFRPLAVTTEAGSAAQGFIPTAVALEPESGRVFVASFNTTGVRITELGQSEPVYRALASNGFLRIAAMEAGPGGYVYFAEQVDRKLGAAVAWNVSPPQFRLFRFKPQNGPPGETALDEVRLQVPPVLAPYLADGTLYTHLEPSALAWHGGKLYMGDLATGLIYEFTPKEGQIWPGQVYAGRVVDGRPQMGDSGGPRLDGAAFGGLTHLLWHGADLFFPDTERSVVRAIDAAGDVRLVAGLPATRGFGGDGGPALEARFDYPQGLAFDPAGRLYVADSDNARIRVIEDGRVRTIAGGGTPRTRDGDALDVSVGAIRNLRFDTAGNLLFTDDETARVRKLWLQHGL